MEYHCTWDTTPFWLDDLQTHHGLKFSFEYLTDLKGLLEHFANAGKSTTFVSYDATAVAQLVAKRADQ